MSFKDSEKEGELYINVEDFGVQKINIVYDNEGQGFDNFLFSLFGLGFKIQDNLEKIEFTFLNGKYIPANHTNSVLTSVKVKPNLAIKNTETKEKQSLTQRLGFLVTDNSTKFTLITKSEYNELQNSKVIDEENILKTEEIEKLIHNVKENKKDSFKLPFFIVIR